jgi:hypothetical protein
MPIPCRKAGDYALLKNKRGTLPFGRGFCTFKEQMWHSAFRQGIMHFLKTNVAGKTAQAGFLLSVFG